jgi:hypothetical protein
MINLRNLILIENQKRVKRKKESKEHLKRRKVKQTRRRKNIKFGE